MSATDAKNATAATSETIGEVFHEAMRSYEKALKSCIQLKEESVNLLKDPLTKNGALDLKRTARDGMNIVEPGLDTDKVGTVAAASNGAVNMHSIKGQVAVITGAAGGIGQALALDMTRRGATGIALVVSVTGLCRRPAK